MATQPFNVILRQCHRGTTTEYGTLHNVVDFEEGEALEQYRASEKEEESEVKEREEEEEYGENKHALAAQGGGQGQHRT
ncbi:hypothetical protein scyTo_0002317 [Scyliorhinus torazame]|uniref:Uncharacterized protein n=1 Tax=Scyliorhinus torazame TaxID=75743 RepID=A0A401PIT7_SCYTO|nr:hypothetical protein [Scyliorhinus torazame]